MAMLTMNNSYFNACEPILYSPPPYRSTLQILSKNPTQMTVSLALSPITYCSTFSAKETPVLVADAVSSENHDLASSSTASTDNQPQGTALVAQIVVPPSADTVINVEALIEPSLTISVTEVQTSAPSQIGRVDCGHKTSCWDGVVSLGPNCPRVRYGG
jgi:hypothetical protein